MDDSLQSLALARISGRKYLKSCAGAGVCDPVTTTTLKIPDAINVGFADAAQQAGKTAHAFMIGALEAETRRAEMRKDFVISALKAERDIDRYGEVYAMNAVHRYFSERLAGKNPTRPKSNAPALKTRR